MKSNLGLAEIVCTLALTGCNCEHERSDSLIEVETEQPNSEVVVATEQTNSVSKLESNEFSASEMSELSPSIAELEVEKKSETIYESSHLSEVMEHSPSKDSLIEDSSDIKVEL